MKRTFIRIHQHNKILIVILWIASALLSLITYNEGNSPQIKAANTLGNHLNGPLKCIIYQAKNTSCYIFVRWDRNTFGIISDLLSIYLFQQFWRERYPWVAISDFVWPG